MSKGTAIFSILAGVLIYLAGSLVGTSKGTSVIILAVCLLLFALLWEVSKKCSKK